jgi:membrane protease YdiL (CAAX protease family)
MIKLIGVLFIVFLLFIIIEGIISNIKKRNKIISEKQMIEDYKSTIIWHWVPLIIIIIGLLFNSVSLNSIGFNKVDFKLGIINFWFELIVLLLCLIFAVLIIYQIISFIFSKKYREDSSKTKIPNEAINVIPRTKKEKQWWSYVSLSAAITEEIIYRGFLLYMLKMFIPNINIFWHVILASIIFGLAHSYQGISGIIKTSIIGFVFNILYLVLCFRLCSFTF